MNWELGLARSPDSPPTRRPWRCSPSKLQQALGWHLCRMELPRKDFNSTTKNGTKVKMQRPVHDKMQSLVSCTKISHWHFLNFFTSILLHRDFFFLAMRTCRHGHAKQAPSRGLVAPSTGWMLYYLCFTPVDRYRTPSAIGSAIGRPYLASIQAGALNRLVLNYLGSLTARLWCYSVENPF